jgi:hypothetical protein
MLGLITDRTQRNVYRRKELAAKGWAGMTTEERAEWLGNPFEATGANLFATGVSYPYGVDLKYYNKEIIATATWDGPYLFAISIIGKASDYENKIYTLSAEGFVSPAKIDLFWHDGNGYDYAGGTLLTAGSTTVDTITFKNVNNREYLAAYFYVTQDTSVTAGKIVRFSKVMLELGSEKHEYVPYTEILPTIATKGAYNYSDLNRVERAVAEISERMALGLETKTNWTMWEIPTEADMNRYLGNIAAIRLKLPNGANVPNAPTTMNNFTYEQANNIELILSAAYETLN